MPPPAPISESGVWWMVYVAKLEFSARLRKLSANVENFPQTSPGQKPTLWDPAEASIITCHDQASPCASFLPAA